MRGEQLTDAIVYDKLNLLKKDFPVISHVIQEKLMKISRSFSGT